MPAMRTPKYVEAVDWIATNDCAGDNDSVEILATMISVLLTADLFGVDAATVARDVSARRGNFAGRNEIARQWKAYDRRHSSTEWNR